MLAAVALVGPSALAAAPVPRAAATGEDDDRPMVAAPLVPLAHGTQSNLEVGLGAMVSAGADVPLDGQPPELAPGDGRLALSASWGPAWRAALQVDAVQEQPLVEAQGSWAPHHAAVVRAGRFKIPVSGEWLLPDADPPFNARARMVEALSPGRATGAELSGRVLRGRGFYRLGGFGGAPEPGATGRLALGAARVGLSLPLEHGAVVVAGGAAHSTDTGLSLPSQPGPWTGGRTLAGMDARLTLGDVSLSGEVLAGWFTPERGESRDALGSQATLAWQATPWLQALGRWDRWRPPGTRPTDQLTPSLAVVHPELPAFQPQVDVVVPLQEGPLRVVATMTVVVADWGS